MASITENQDQSPTGKFPKNFVMILIATVAVSLTIGMYLSNSLSTANKAKRAEEDDASKVMVEDKTKFNIQAELEAQAKAAEKRRKEVEEAERIAAANKPQYPVVFAPGNATSDTGGAGGSQSYDAAQDKETVLREQASQSPLLAIQKGSMLAMGGKGAGEGEDPAIREALDLAREAAKGGGGGLLNSGGAPARQDPNDAWLKVVSANQNQPGDYVTIRDPMFDRPVLHEGSIIPLVLQNALNSQLPGMVIASATRDIYDSVSGRTLVIPRGTKFIGRFNSQVRQGQDRLMFAFNRMIFPDGRDANLKGMEGGDQIGASGVEGDVNTHFWEMFSSSFLIAMMTVGVENLGESVKNVVVVGGSGSGGYSSAAGQVMVDTAKQSVSRFENMPPTITIEPGTLLNVMVNKDIIL